MVRGIDKFREYFKEYSKQYVLIGGAACDISFAENASEFRATRDLDMVLIVEAKSKEFGAQFWKFIQEGGYHNRVKSNGRPRFYRFEKPSEEGFPQMIELFSRTEMILEETQVIPLHIDDSVPSLSAILLNDEYYQVLLEGCVVINDISILKPTYLIPFKARAWLDLSFRKEQGECIDSRDIKKHKNDILHLSTELVLESNVSLPKLVRADMETFIERLRNEPADLKNLKITGVSNEDIVKLLEDTYLT